MVAVGQRKVGTRRAVRRMTDFVLRYVREAMSTDAREQGRKKQKSDRPFRFLQAGKETQVESWQRSSSDTIETAISAMFEKGSRITRRTAWVVRWE